MLTAEKIVGQWKANVYPITLIKFFLNGGKIKHYIERSHEKTFKYDNNNCPQCAEKEKYGFRCRVHTSIERVMKAPIVMYDECTELFFVQNEIFKRVGDKLHIFYCPHTKLIMGPLSDSRIRKIIPITVTGAPDVSYEQIETFRSDQFLHQRIRCWFNENLSIIVTPGAAGPDEWCLVRN